MNFQLKEKPLSLVANMSKGNQFNLTPDEKIADANFCSLAGGVIGKGLNYGNFHYGVSVATVISLVGYRIVVCVLLLAPTCLIGWLAGLSTGCVKTLGIENPMG